MSFSLRLFILMFVLSACSFALDRNAFTFTKYDLEVRVNPEEQAVAARGKVTLRNDSAQPQKEIDLQISSSLEWRMIEMDGKEVEYISQAFTSDLDHTGKMTEAVVTPSAAIPPKGTVELDVGYSGTIPKDATRLTRIGIPEAQAIASDWDRIGEDFSAVRGIGHVIWYPISADPANLSDNTLFSGIAQWQQRVAQSQMKSRFCWITQEERSFTVVANGTFEGIGGGTGGGEGNRTGCSSFAFTNLSQTVPTFAIAPFEMLTRPLASFYFLQGQDAAVQEYALVVEKIAPWLGEWFNKPSAKIEVVALPEANAVPFDAGTMLFTPLNTRDKKLMDATMAHQLAHAMMPSPRRWISEGLAQFAQTLVRERQDGRRAAIESMQDGLGPLIAASKENAEAAKPSGDAAQSLINTTDEIYYRIKAMFVWWMLRDMIGDAPLQTALKAYRPNLDKDASYMQSLVTAQSKRDLEWFFDDWVYRDRGLPEFQIVSAPARETLNNTHVVAVTVENTGGAGAEVPTIITADTGEKNDRILVQAHQKEIKRIVVPGKPQSVIVNDGSVPAIPSSKRELDIQ